MIRSQVKVILCNWYLNKIPFVFENRKEEGGPMKRGQITVFLSLSLTIIISLLCASIESARVNAMRMQIENATDMGMNSIFAEFHRELLDQYDLYFIDSAYGSGNPSSYFTGEHLREYIEYNLNPGKNLFVYKGVNYTGLSVEDVNISSFTLATDEGGNVFKRQAIHAIKDQYGISMINEIAGQLDIFKSLGIGDRNINQERSEVESQLTDLEIVNDDGTTTKVEIENPADEVNHARADILNLVLGETEDISSRTVSIENLASHRKKNVGDGFPGNTQDLDSVSNELLFGEYLSKKFSTYTNSFHHEALSYEIEYILKGNNSDRENLKEVVKTLIGIREAANVIYLFSDAEKQAEAESMAALIASAAGLPMITEIVKCTLLFAWAFAESVIDVRTLLKGGKVPLIKTPSDWSLSLQNIGEFKKHINSGKESERGLSYGTYLKILLSLENKNQKVMRCLDVIELNIRKTAGNTSFLIDGCIEYIEARVEVFSRFGYQFQIDRNFSYEEIERE